MLERTAVCLELGNLQRLLPASRKPLKSCRTIHAGFWEHGGGDIELSPLWAALVRATAPAEQPDGPSVPRALSGHTGILLDFLYPPGAQRFLRQYSIRGTERQNGRGGRYSMARLGQRQYISSAKEKPSDPDPQPVQFEVEKAEVSESDSNIDMLLETLGLTRSDDFEEAWRQYNLRSADDRYRLRPQLILYISPSHRDPDAERAVGLFQLLGEEQITASIYRSMVKCFLKLRNLADAMRLYNMALKELAMPLGSEELLAYLIEHGLWVRAMSLWEDVTKFEAGQTKRLPSYDIYEIIDKNQNLTDLVLELAKDVDLRRELESSSPETTSRLLKFAAELIQRSLLSTRHFSPSRFDPLLKTLCRWKLDTPSVYEQAMQMLLDLKQAKLALKCYQTARRAKVNFTKDTLENILDICIRHHNVLGMRQVLDDFFRIYSKPTGKAYKMCMKEFAAKGDSCTVHALWEQYISRFTPERPDLVMAPSDFSPILHVHAIRGELQEVLKWFDKMTTDFQLLPDILCWNILLNAYSKVHDYEGAYSCFEKLLNDRDCRSDDYTIGTMMGMCTQQGDIDRIIELYMLAENLGIEKSVVMVDNLVLAHIQDRDLEQAEKICVEALSMPLQGSRTRMWNYLLVAHGQRRDLNNVNRVLQRMSEAGVDNDTYTYSALMQALCMVKQPDRAWQILKEVMPEAGIQATSFHYAVVMGGYVQTGEAQKAFAIQNRMFRKGFKDSGSTKLLAIKSQLSADEKLLLDGTPKEVMDGAFKLFREAMSSMDAEDLVAVPKKGATRYSMDIAYPSMFYSYVMHILASSSDTDSVDQLYAEFMSILPESHQEHSPLQIMSALMFAKLRAGDHESVEECWRLSLAQAKERGQPLPPISTGSNTNEENVPLSPYKIVPVRRFDISKHLYLYLESLFMQNQIDAMVSTVEGVLADGFALDNRTWNHYVQLLAQKYRCKTAFKTCEERLIDNWTGWQMTRLQAPERNRLSFELRNMRRQADHFRPIHITLLYLARALLDVQSMAAESRPSEVLLDDIRHTCPKTVKAIENMPRTDSELERRILREW